MKTILALLLLAVSVMNAKAQGTGSDPSDVHSAAPPVVTGTPNDPTGKFVALCLATPRIPGRKSSPPAVALIIRRGCGYSAAQRLAVAG